MQRPGRQEGGLGWSKLEQVIREVKRIYEVQDEEEEGELGSRMKERMDGRIEELRQGMGELRDREREIVEELESENAKANEMVS
jgi:hypothetical protein